MEAITGSLRRLDGKEEESREGVHDGNQESNRFACQTILGSAMPAMYEYGEKAREGTNKYISIQGGGGGELWLECP